MGLNHPFGNSQSETHSPGISRSRLIDPVKSIKHFLPVFRRNSGAAILDGCHNRSLLVRSYKYRNRTPGGRILDGIVQNVKERLPKEKGVPGNPGILIPFENQVLFFLLHQYFEELSR